MTGISLIQLPLSFPGPHPQRLAGYYCAKIAHQPAGGYAVGKASVLQEVGVRKTTVAVNTHQPPYYIPAVAINTHQRLYYISTLAFNTHQTIYYISTVTVNTHQRLCYIITVTVNTHQTLYYISTVAINAHQRLPTFQRSPLTLIRDRTAF
jgi:hypothetical protein